MPHGLGTVGGVGGRAGQDAEVARGDVASEPAPRGRRPGPFEQERAPRSAHQLRRAGAGRPRSAEGAVIPGPLTLGTPAIARCAVVSVCKPAHPAGGVQLPTQQR
eukprot:scaffold17034_cov90-Isochrysis_galbana.AAC.1